MENKNKQQYYIELINEELDSSRRFPHLDTRQDCLLCAMVYALSWIAEELHEVNERCNDDRLY